ncbi:MAG: hypothetical protein KAU95_02345 [Candidatus Aenigmarchaeota archaeon]|nr:hypothetical protein [Candidatus Aenigmarchaeota archaeon]
MKGEMAMELIVKWIIVLVAVAVVIGIFLNFSSKFSNPFGEHFESEEKPDFPKIITQDEFSAGGISTYIESCYLTMTSLHDNEQMDMDCYILNANNTFSSFTSETDILDSLPSDIQEHIKIETGFNKQLIIIRFEDIGDKIIISD